MVDYEIQSELQSTLSSGERLLWTGRPKKGIAFRSSDIFLIPFSMLWCGFAIFWESSVFSMDTPLFFRLWGVPFVLMGLYITVGRFFVDAWRRSKTIYGITADRIIIRSGIFSQSVNSLNIRTLADLTFTQKTNNSGTITMGPSDFRYAMFQGLDWPGVKQPPRLEFVEDVKRVYDLIIDHQRQK